MTPFDEDRAVHRIRELLLERLDEWTPEEIRRSVRHAAKRLRMNLDEAYEEWEGKLLATNPNPERW